VTASTLRKSHLFAGADRLDFLLGAMRAETERFGWLMEAWAVFPNHYHFVALAPERAETLTPMMRAIHSRSAIRANRLDATPGRRVWFQYRDTCLTNETSYLARLNYTHRNPEKHGVVRDARDYRWCSMAWFAENAEDGFRRTVLSFDASKVEILDDF